jgi:(p)ppGpp synthase/HD superfamily hydrolase
LRQRQLTSTHLWLTGLVYTIKSELEDLSLKYNNPDVYNEILNKLEVAKEGREKYVEEFKKEVSEQLKEENSTSPSKDGQKPSALFTKNAEAECYF